MTTAPQTELPMFQVAKDNCNVDWFVGFLEGRDWITAAEILRAIGWPVNEDNKRWLRALRKASQGRVIGGPGTPGFKLLQNCTREEFNHWRNGMLSQAREMRFDVLYADKLWFARQAVEGGVG